MKKLIWLGLAILSVTLFVSASGQQPTVIQKRLELRAGDCTWQVTPDPGVTIIKCVDQNMTFTATVICPTPQVRKDPIKWTASAGATQTSGSGGSFTTAFTTPGTKTVTADCGECGSKTWNVTVTKVDMTAHRPLTETDTYGNPFRKVTVPESSEEDPGAGIRVNGDDDNNNSTPDKNETSVANENDLIEVLLEVGIVSALEPGLEYVLKRSNNNIKVWNSKNKNAAILDAGTEAILNFTTLTKTVWVENPGGGNADLELLARKTAGGEVICDDKVHFYAFTSIVIALGGENQVPTDPPNPGEGVFGLALTLYTRGYDVHMYDEDNVGADGAGAVYNEVVSAVQKRNVSKIAIFGYSHGGGSTHDLSERLDDNKGTIGAFTVPYTAYIDAVENDSDYDMDQERRRPPGTAYHVNYYQEGTLEDYYLDGGPIDPPGADYEVNVDAPTERHTHFTIDDDWTILRDIRDRLEARVTK